MRFKANLTNQKLLYSIVQCMEKVDKTGIIRLSKDKIILIARQTDGENTQVHGVVPSVNLFSEMRIQSKLRNEIVIEVQLKNLSAALKSANNALAIVAKLTKKQEIGYLSFEIKTQVAKGKETSNVVTVVQDVPIRVLLQEEIQVKVVEPDFSSHCQNPLIISLPKLKEMKSVIDKMKSTHNGTVEVSGSPTGQLRLLVTSTLVSIRTIYKGLNVKASPPNTINEVYTSEITVKLKSLSRLLHAHNANPTDVNCIFADGTALIVDVYLESNGEGDEAPKSYLTYYITAVQ
ncbi:hypothetical protein NAEGRDRAFT_29264 [Naegleria gruberi]|uniref:Checkpoint protein n=1 Tax=Naegleria gruberi TaxID=5762 RepID=D2UYC8_NAEGR|nr:uncharacterized protein NAEGRDRAFT_29264 [Naegleria gruberi]EFC50453.1 hypothetical protein NAEGRDRAFT_29264 [Naegleria gruberi]|eukprot:XP_002683197.1 hypothetical protein NAEGRDRAFT_29264 [Naegleria gruberi strain NEG-M]